MTPNFSMSEWLLREGRFNAGADGFQGQESITALFLSYTYLAAASPNPWLRAHCFEFFCKLL